MYGHQSNTGADLMCRALDTRPRPTIEELNVHPQILDSDIPERRHLPYSGRANPDELRPKGDEVCFINDNILSFFRLARARISTPGFHTDMML